MSSILSEFYHEISTKIKGKEKTIAYLKRLLRMLWVNIPIFIAFYIGMKNR